MQQQAHSAALAVRPRIQLQNWASLQFRGDDRERFILTDEDAEAVHDFVASFFTFDTHGAEYDALVLFVTSFATRQIERYGDDGYGDKPEHLNRYAYWASHISNSKLEETLDKIRNRPASRLAVTMTKKNAKSKCHSCKQPFSVGDLSLSERCISGCGPFDPNFSWRVRSTQYTCAPCVRNHPELFKSIHGTACIVDTSDEHRKEAAEEFANWLNVRVGAKRQREE